MNNITKTGIIILLFIASFFMAIPVFAVEEEIELKNEEKVEKLVSKVSFDEILDKAKEHSYDLKIADYQILISKQEVRGARSEYFPKLNFSAGTEYTKNFRDARESTVMSIGDAFINPYTRYQSVLGISVGYNLFDFGIRGDNLKIAKEDVILKELENKEKLQEMNLTLLDSYTKALITDKQIKKNKDILALQEKNLQYKERLFNAKEISKTELNDETVKVKVTKNKISELNSIKTEALEWISFYTGEKYDIDNITLKNIERSDFDVNSFQDYSKSIIWKIHEKNIKKKELELKVAKKNYLPKIHAYGSYYLYGSDHDHYGKSLDIEPSNFSVGASLNMPVFDGFKNSALVQKTSLELKQLLLERDKAIAQLMTRLAVMRTNLSYVDEQIDENNKIIEELTDKTKSTHKLLSKKLISPIEDNEAKIELINQEIEFDKNSATKTALIKGIEILTAEN